MKWEASLASKWRHGECPDFEPFCLPSGYFCHSLSRQLRMLKARIQTSVVPGGLTRWEWEDMFGTPLLTTSFDNRRG